MSTGIVAIDRPPRMAMSSAMTTKVYGRRSASLTIHMGRLILYRAGPQKCRLRLTYGAASGGRSLFPRRGPVEHDGNGLQHTALAGLQQQETLAVGGGLVHGRVRASDPD